MTESTFSLVDTHCHLTQEEFEFDREQVIQRAQTAGVHTILVPGIDLESSRRSIALTKQYPSIYAAVGIHPHNAREWTTSSRDELLSLAESPRVVAIGEIGLDYYRNLSPKEIQLEVFQAQLELAGELSLPVIIHNRDATEDVVSILLEWSKSCTASFPEGKGVLHAYSADISTARKVIDAGFFLGIAGPITYRNSHKLREITACMPHSRLLIETDAPYLSPHPYRGKRNEPSNVSLVAEHLSKVIDKDLSYTARKTTMNAAGLFGWENGKNHRTLH
jgi:TatD DNase family protein